MSEENNEIVDRNETESEKPQQYYVEGYFDTAFSMPAETEQTHSYRIKASSALPAFPPHDYQNPDGERIKPFRSILLFVMGLVVVLFLTMLVRLVLKYDFEITRENGSIHIMIKQRYLEDDLADETRPVQTDFDGIVDSGGTGTDPSPGTHYWNGNAFELAGIPADGMMLSYQKVYKKCIDSMVSVYVADKDSQKAGSGVIMSSDGYIITNNHLIESSVNIVVFTSEGEEYQAAVVGQDNVSDLAVLKINATRLKPAEFGNSDYAEIGDSVLAIGNPLNKTLSMTDGIISAVNRNMSFNGYYMTLIQTNADINEGNSGGALINRFGQVIGITNMKIVSVNNTIEGMGFAIPMKEAKPIIEELMAHGYVKGRPSLGIIVEDIPAVASVFYRVPTGVLIVSLYENSDAYDQGLLPGDIIVAANGVKIDNQDALFAIQNSLSVDDTIILDVFRVNQYYSVPVTLMDASSFD